MKELNKIGSTVKEGLLWTIFGPETTGKIQYAFPDRNDPLVLHLLLVTLDQQEEKHFMFKSLVNLYVDLDGNVRYPGWRKFKRSDLFTIRVRGKGFIPMPWKNIDRDPFNLEPDKNLPPEAQT